MRSKRCYLKNPALLLGLGIKQKVLTEYLHKNNPKQSFSFYFFKKKENPQLETLLLFDLYESIISHTSYCCFSFNLIFKMHNFERSLP